MPRQSKQQPIAVIDCETDPFLYGRVPEPFIWGFYNGSEYREFAETADVAEFLSTYKGIVFAHNGGKFDFHFLLEYLEPGSAVRVIDGRIAEARIGDCRLRDSFALLPVGLKQFEKQDFDYALLEPGRREANMPRIRDYLRSDCVNLYRFIREYLENFPLSLTLAGAAFKVWRDMAKIEIPDLGRRHYETFRPFYFGGRVQCFEIGVLKGPFAIVDINSAYPAVMTEKHPWGGAVEHRRVFKAADAARSFVDVSGTNYGALPRRLDGPGRKVSYGTPEGEYGRFQVTGREYLAGLETGTFEPDKVHTVFRFKQTIDFGEYVGHFYAMKDAATRAGNTTQRLIAKLFLNSLYGKMAANPETYRDWLVDRFDANLNWELPKDQPKWRGGPLCGGDLQLFYRPTRETMRRYYNVATGASITGAVRAFLWRSICATRRPVYCDTDSIICADTGDLKLSPALGDWDLEGSPQTVAIAGKKLYAAWNAAGEAVKTASKGVHLTANQIAQVAQGGTVTYKRDAPTFSLKGSPDFVCRTVRATG